ncbi:protein of unknown function (plasmid) [Shinella sp. WSC3-e]|nr:hypothetical protein SHINE37_100175 [Rhizobiaceae bacterium]CAI0335800.1 hypothetical protein SHINE37_20009 [Rhizobiaceae bacterium]CAK7261722.1 protein of unknown function [Shinella sp. WSC3-e]
MANRGAGPVGLTSLNARMLLANVCFGDWSRGVERQEWGRIADGRGASDRHWTLYLPQQWVDSPPSWTHFVNKWNGNARSASGLGEYLGALRFSHGNIFSP